MKEKFINHIMKSIKNKNNYNDVKLLEIKYGLEGLYTLVTKSFVIIIISLLLHITHNFLLFCLFYIPLRSVGFGTHAKSNIQCWIFSTILLLGIPYLFNLLKFSILTKSIIWIICFINFIIFCPADTEKRPMVNKIRKLKFKIAIMILSLIYLVIIMKFNTISNFVLASMVLQSFLVNPIGYILMGQKVRFRLSIIDLNRNRLEV